jgi:hypothetical protein
MNGRGRGGPFAVLGQVGELDAVVGQDHTDLVGNGLNQLIEEGDGGDGVGPLDQPGEGELGGASMAMKR